MIGRSDHILATFLRENGPKIAKFGFSMLKQIYAWNKAFIANPSIAIVSTDTKNNSSEEWFGWDISHVEKYTKVPQEIRKNFRAILNTWKINIIARKGKTGGIWQAYYRAPCLWWVQGSQQWWRWPWCWSNSTCTRRQVKHQRSKWWYKPCKGNGSGDHSSVKHNRQHKIVWVSRLYQFIWLEVSFWCN